MTTRDLIGREEQDIEPRYYSAIVRSDDHRVMLPPGVPLSGFSKVMAQHARELSMCSPGRPSKYESRILLDIGTVAPDDEAQMRRILQDDPVLRAVFELGRQYGMNQMASLT